MSSNLYLSGLNGLSQLPLISSQNKLEPVTESKSSFQHTFSTESTSLTKKSNAGSIMKLTHRYMNSTKAVNKSAYLPKVENLLKSMEDTTLSLRAVVGKEGLINLEEIEDLQEMNGKLNDVGKNYASLGFSLLDIYTDLQTNDDVIAEAEPLLSNLEEQLNELLTYIRDASGLEGDLNQDSPFGFHELGSPEMMAFQLQSTLTKSILSNLGNGSDDAQEDLNTSIFGGNNISSQGGLFGNSSLFGSEAEYLAALNNGSNPGLNLGGF